MVGIVLDEAATEQEQRRKQVVGVLSVERCVPPRRVEFAFLRGCMQLWIINKEVDMPCRGHPCSPPFPTSRSSKQGTREWLASSKRFL